MSVNHNVVEFEANGHGHPNYSSGENTKKQIKQMVLDNPKITAVEIINRLAKRNAAPSKFLVEGVRSDMRQTLKLLKERGLIDVEL